jgi:hypothetical protein
LLVFPKRSTVFVGLFNESPVGKDDSLGVRLIYGRSNILC